MESSGPIREARDLFFSFVHQWDDEPNELHQPPLDPEERRYLQYYLKRWLERDDGIPATGGKFEIYQRAVMDIADAVMQGEIDLNYQGSPEAPYADNRYADSYERPIVGIHNPSFDSSQALDKTFYEVTVFRRTHSPDLTAPPFPPYTE